MESLQTLLKYYLYFRVKYFIYRTDRFLVSTMKQLELKVSVTILDIKTTVIYFIAYRGPLLLFPRENCAGKPSHI